MIDPQHRKYGPIEKRHVMNGEQVASRVTARGKVIGWLHPLRPACHEVHVAHSETLLSWMAVEGSRFAYRQLWPANRAAIYGLHMLNDPTQGEEANGELGGLQSTKVERKLLSDGYTYEVRHALREDGSCPSLTAFGEMAEGRWEEDPDLEEVPDEAQIDHADKFLAGIEFFAEHGYPNNRFCTVNALRDGIWEFKLGRKRVSFFDTNGYGDIVPKLKVLDRRTSEFPDDEEFWWIPRFDENLRVGHCFGKNSQKTEEHDLDESEKVREEDIEHDRVA